MAVRVDGSGTAAELNADSPESVSFRVRAQIVAEVDRDPG